MNYFVILGFQKNESKQLYIYWKSTTINQTIDGPGANQKLDIYNATFVINLNLFFMCFIQGVFGSFISEPCNNYDRDCKCLVYYYYNQTMISNSQNHSSGKRRVSYFGLFIFHHKKQKYHDYVQFFILLYMKNCKWANFVK